MPALFDDLRQAGRVLASLMRVEDPGDSPVILALPPYGVPVAFEVARGLGAGLDVFSVRTLRLPGEDGRAIGALTSGGVRLLDDVLAAGVPLPTIERLVRYEARELERRETAYRDGRAPIEVPGRNVIMVDDGLATGATMRVAIAALRRLGAARITVAVPLGAVEASRDVLETVDLLVCAAHPEPFGSVGAWYADFTPPTDEEVHDLLAASRQGGATL